MKQAIVLAAGKVNRLRPFTVNKPKVMLAVAGKPILQYVIEALTRERGCPIDFPRNLAKSATVE